MRPAFPPPRRSWLTARRTATLDNEYSDDDGIDEISRTDTELDCVRRSEEPRPRRASMCRASSFIQPLPKQQSSAPHRLARDSERYFSTKHVSRYDVDDEHVPWHVPFPGYAPASSGFELAADPRAGSGLNPGGRTGLTGGWDASAVAGANYVVDPIITRFQPGSGQRRLQLLAVLRLDCEEWAIPGATLRASPGGGGWESDKTAMVRGLREQGVDIVDLAEGGTARPVFRGYVDDARNTDDAWIETTVRHYHLADLGQGEIQSPGVKWVDISPQVPIYQPHRAWVHHVADEMLKVPQIERQMRGLSLQFVFRPVPALWSDPEVLRLIATSSDHISGSEMSRTVVNTAKIFSVSAIDLRLSSLQLRDGVRALLSSNGGKSQQWVRCRCARFAPITVGWELRARFNIPQHATHQAFVYGVLDARDFEAVDGQPDRECDPFEGLLVSGGFVYANCDGSRAEVLRVTYVSLPTNDLYSKNHTVEFTGPYRMITPAREVHRVRGQWRDVTLSFLLEIGAESFLWLNPGEEAGEHPIKFGAFAYSSSPSGQGEAVYFYLKVADDEAMPLAKAASVLDEEQTAYLRGVGVEAPVEVARKPDHSGKGVDGQRCAAQDAADRNWLVLHDAVAMGDAALVDSLVRDERLLPEELVEFQLTRRLLSRGHDAPRGRDSPAMLHRVDVPASGSVLTPLQVAATHGHSAVVRVLLRRGASPTIQAADGATAIDLALCDDELSVEQLLGKLDSAIALLPALFRVSAGEALCYVAEIARRARSEAGLRKRTYPAEAGDLMAAAERAQNLGTVLFKHLSILQRVHLLESEGSRARTVPHASGQAGMVERPRHFLARAVGVQCKILLADATVQSAIERRWMGELSHSVVSGYVVTPDGVEQKVRRPLSRALLLVLAVGLNFLVLPFVALVPSLRSVLLRSLDLGFRLASTHRTPHSEDFKRKWNPSAQLYTDSLYLLDVPVFQFVLSSISWALLALWLTLVPTPTLAIAVDDIWGGVSALVSQGASGVVPALERVTGGLWSVLTSVLLLGWLCAHLLEQGFSSSDFIKQVEMVSVSLAISAKLMPPLPWGHQTLAFGLLLMWTSWFLRVFSICGMGPQVVMLRKMMMDTLQFLVLMAGCAAAFAAALYTLFRSTPLDGGEECGPLEDLSQSLPVALYRLLLISLDPGSSIECAGAVAETLEAGTAYDFRFAAPFIMSVYVVLSVVLLLNMLIAIMAKTFDVVWDDAENENSFVKAQLAVGYFDDAWPPPPFNLLRLPAVCGATVLRLLSPRQRCSGG